jgi:hypothetical protein
MPRMSDFETSTESAHWRGHDFSVLPIERVELRLLPKEPGLYIMATCTGAGTWGAVYIGKAKDLRARFAWRAGAGYHDQWYEALKYRFSHLHICCTISDWELELREALLIQYYRPHLNKQHNGAKWCGPRSGPPSGRPGFVDPQESVYVWLDLLARPVSPAPKYPYRDLRF